LSADVRIRAKMKPFKNVIRLVSGCALCVLSSPGHASGAADWQPPAWTAMDQVRLGGVYGRRLERSCDRLHLPPLNDPGYVLADIALDRKRIFTEYSGDISGRMMGVEAMLASYSAREAATLKTLLQSAPAFQKPDGHFGASQHLPALERSSDMPLLWGNGRLLIGLVEAYESTGDPAVLKTAKKLGDYFVETDGVYCRKENLQSVGGRSADAFATCYFSCIEGLVALGRVTGEARYRREAERIAELALGETFFDDLHSHGRLSALRGIVALYELTGEAKWLQGAERDWTKVVERYLLPTGGITELFSRSAGRDEGCAVSDWLRLNLALWRMTGQGRYLDEAERCLKNHFLYQQFAAGGAGHRLFINIKGEPAAFRGDGVDAYWCCCEHWPRAMADVARLAVTRAADGLSVNLFVDLKAHLAAAKVPWDVEMEETEDGIRIEAKPAEPTTATLRIHRPAWATAARLEAPKKLNVSELDNEWVVGGQWKGRQTLRVHLPQAVRVERTAAGGTVLFSGWDMLVAHGVPANGWLFESPPKAWPTLYWAAAIADGKTWVVPAMTENTGSGSNTCRLLRLAPMRDLKGAFPHRSWFVFEVNHEARPLSVLPVNATLFLTVAATSPCGVFLNGQAIGRTKGWNSPVERFDLAKAKGKNTLLLLSEPATDPKRVPAAIAGICGADGSVEAGRTGWQARALTPEEAGQNPAAILAASGWHSARELDPRLVPSRENTQSVLEDVPANWFTSEVEAGKPVLALRLRW
jgi:hypothetical protein